MMKPITPEPRYTSDTEYELAKQGFHVPRPGVDRYVCPRGHFNKIERLAEKCVINNRNGTGPTDLEHFHIHATPLEVPTILKQLFKKNKKKRKKK